MALMLVKTIIAAIKENPKITYDGLTGKLRVNKPYGERNRNEGKHSKV